VADLSLGGDRGRIAGDSEHNSKELPTKDTVLRPQDKHMSTSGCHKSHLQRVGQRTRGQGEQILRKEVAKRFQDARFRGSARGPHSFPLVLVTCLPTIFNGNRSFFVSDYTPVVPIVHTLGINVTTKTVTAKSVRRTSQQSHWQGS